MQKQAIYHKGMLAKPKNKLKRRALGASGVVKIQRLGREVVVTIGRAKRRVPISQCVYGSVGTPTSTRSTTL